MFMHINEKKKLAAPMFISDITGYGTVLVKLCTLTQQANIW